MKTRTRRVALLLASREAVQRAIDDPAQLVLDVRAEGEYTGELSGHRGQPTTSVVRGTFRGRLASPSACYAPRMEP